MARNKNANGFTLVELLVVIAIIGILVALLLPAVQAAREAARRSQCINNLKQIGLAVLNYESSRSYYPPGSRTLTDNFLGPYYATWTVEILPYMELQNLYDVWDSTVDFSHDNNTKLRETVVQSYVCPTGMPDEQLQKPDTGPGSGKLWAVGSYKANAGRARGSNAIEYWDEPRIDQVSYSRMPASWQGPMHVTVEQRKRAELVPVKVRKITDGLSKTLLVGEYHTATRPERSAFWAYAYSSYNQAGGFKESRTLLADYERCLAIGGGGQDTCKRGWGSFHSGTIQFVYCDGSVSGVDVNVDMESFVAATTIQDGEFESIAGQ